MKKQTKGFILGAVIGIGAGMLLAPYRGVTMRKKVSAKINELSNYIKNMDSDTLRSDCLGILKNINSLRQRECIKKRITLFAYFCY